MIGIITGSESQNGYYEQATKIIRMVESILFSLNTVMSARQSYLFAQKKYDEIRDKIYKSFDYLFFIGIGTMFGIIGIARNFVPWFFGQGYEPVISILYFMAPLPVVISLSNILGCQYLTPSGQRTRSTKGIVTGAVVNLTLNAALIPLYSSVGATIASVCAEGVISIIYMHMSKEYVSWKFLFSISWRKLLSGCAMMIIVLLIGLKWNGNIWITFLQIIVGALAYSIILYFMKDKSVIEVFKLLKEKIHGRA